MNIEYAMRSGGKITQGCKKRRKGIFLLAALGLLFQPAQASEPVANASEPVAHAALPWVEAQEAALPNVKHGQFVFRFTGAGGFYLGDESSAILVDPFFSNPDLWQIASLRDLHTDKTLVDRYLPITDHVKAVLVGHAHYDHALDIPYVFSKLPPEARVYGSETLSNMLAVKIPEAHRVNVEPHMADAGKPGEWLSVTPRLRVFPIASEHSPHVGRWIVANGKLHAALQQLPADSLDWVAGTTLSYLVDFLDEGGRVAYRVFVQTSSSNPPKGVPPSAILADGYPVNVAVLCAANFTNVDNYPETVLTALSPQQVVIVHWEKFWEAYELNKATPLPGLDLDKFYARVKTAAPTADVKLPQRGAQFLLQTFQPPGGHPHGE